MKIRNKRRAVWLLILFLIFISYGIYSRPLTFSEVVHSENIQGVSLSSLEINPARDPMIHSTNYQDSEKESQALIKIMEGHQYRRKLSSLFDSLHLPTSSITTPTREYVISVVTKRQTGNPVFYDFHISNRDSITVTSTANFDLSLWDSNGKNLYDEIDRLTKTENE